MTLTLQDLTDHTEITGLIDRYLRSLDEARFDDAWARGLFTADIRISTPVGDQQGLDGLAEAERATMAKFRRTQHIGTNHLIDLDGDRATVRWNALMTHVHLDTADGRFVVGGTFSGEVVRTDAGWRFRRLEVRAVWTQGEGPRVRTAKAEQTLRELNGTGTAPR
ncbi:nuclear transport factor 2 family protein [Streptomyces sp. NPDC052396]|uniref:nuclear transport factor 2 family protein n=1 Tax=Streptomyces sp. NPDC052396 TaxID=3365689 RepID=UPI0037CD18D7